MQAITTKYIGPTNTRGSRVKARCEAGSITVHWDHALDVEDNHTVAAKTLRTKLGWDQDCYPNMYRGGTKDGYVFVFAAEHCEVTK